MMVINKSIRRNLKHNISFYFSASLLTAIGVFLVILMYTSIRMIDTDFNEIMNKQHVEDCQFTTLIPIDDNKIIEFEDKFDIIMEKICFIDEKKDDYTLRIFRPTEKINVYSILEGNDIDSSDEILINRDFGKEGDHPIGSSLDILGSSYRISGYCVRPDYLYAQKEITDFYVDNKTFGQVTISKETFDTLPNTNSYYSVIYNTDNELLFRKYINDNYTFINYLSSNSNNRIKLAKDFIGEYELIIDMIMPFVFVLISFLISIVIGRMIIKEQKQIGTLIALGYSKNQIKIHYSVYGLIPGIIGSILGILISIILLRPACTYFAMDYEEINFNINIHPASIVVSILTPSLLYLIAIILKVRKLLKKDIVTLLKGTTDDSPSGRSFFKKTNLSFKIKFKIRSILSSKTRSLVIIAGIYISSFLCVFGFIFMDSCNQLIENGLSNDNINYRYYLNTILTALPEEGEPVMVSSYEALSDNNIFNLMGLNSDNKYIKIDSDGYYITSNGAALYGLKKGDIFKFMNVQTLNVTQITISGIIEDNNQCALYTTMENASKLAGLDNTSYNMIISDKRIDVKSDLIYKLITKEDIEKQIKTAIELMYGLIYILIVFGSVICIISTYLTVNLIVGENKLNISMLKILGYKNREINSLILNINHILVPIGFLLSIFSCLKLAEIMFKSFIAEFNIYIRPIISPFSIFICFAVIVFSYGLSLYILKRKVYKINMVTILKDTRE